MSFPEAVQVQAHVALCVTAYRSEMAFRLRMEAGDYEYRAAELLATDPTQAAWLEGVAEGLRTAAAEIDVQEATAA